MKTKSLLMTFALFSLGQFCKAQTEPETDTYLWLEDVEGKNPWIGLKPKMP